MINGRDFYFFSTTELAYFLFHDQRESAGRDLT